MNTIDLKNTLLEELDFIFIKIGMSHWVEDMMQDVLIYSLNHITKKSNPGLLVLDWNTLGQEML